MFSPLAAISSLLVVVNPQDEHLIGAVSPPVACETGLKSVPPQVGQCSWMVRLYLLLSIITVTFQKNEVNHPGVNRLGYSSLGWRLHSVAFNQRHFRPIDRNHHARGVAVDFNWDAPQLIWLGEGVDDVELPQLFRCHLDQLGLGVVVGLPVQEERVANALVDYVDRGFIGHGLIVSERGETLRRMTGNS